MDENFTKNAEISVFQFSQPAKIPPSVPVLRSWVEGVHDVMSEMASHAEDCTEQARRLRRDAANTRNLEMRIQWHKEARKLEAEAGRVIEWVKGLQGRPERESF